ncbi:MAG TPA: tetratricopeptide repeat protein [Pyrinomonadaceae bacterium]|nr:tetratricopeptide repeat protein [Pyrinomonadaceae bacterium]
MDYSRQARTKATKTLIRFGAITTLLFAHVLTIVAQQPAKSVGRVPPASPPPATTRPRTANSPVTTTTNDVNKLLGDGQAAFDAGRYEEAIARYNKVLALSANQPRTAAVASLLIGNVNMAQRKFGNAEVAFQRAVTLSPTFAEGYNGLGEALGELKQFPRAIEAFNKAVGLDPKLLKAKYNQAVTYDRMKNFRYSEFVFRSLIKNHPDYALAYDGLAVTLSKAGRAKEAIPLHEKAIALSPRESSYYFNYAISNLMLGNTAKALEQQQRLRAIDPLVAERLASVIIKRQM